ncbi:SCO1860 family LAETG-anchored protein [Streptomyces sp. NPDC088725]|uniref:SCO1860 family LAETG-anchored protein n=1 Tax=Streptomyces sp. NPDC088725 TaxID=3365873 RepID=UPI003824557F
MNSNTFRMPARRCATVVASAVLTAGPVLLAAPAQANGGDAGEGRASAAVLRTGLDVSLLNKTVHLPLNAELNAVQAPASADRSVLSVELDGVGQGRPFTVLSADVATAKATADAHGAAGSTHLAHARLHVPGLPLLSLIEVEEVTSKAVCEAGKRPTAQANVLGQVTVLGKKVTLSASGPTRVDVQGVGRVTLDLSTTRTTSRTAAATALALKVSVNPLKLNVAEVEGSVTLAEATCRSPKPQAPAEPQAPAPAHPDHQAQSAVEPVAAPADESLAETGGSSLTPYLAGGAAALLVLGGGATAWARSRARR